MTKYSKMLSRVVTISTYAIIFCVIGNMVMPALFIESVQAQAVSDMVNQGNKSSDSVASAKIMQKKVGSLLSDLDSLSKDNTKDVAAFNQSNKLVLDKYINKIGKAKLKKLSDSYDKLNETDKSKFLSGLSDVELSAFVAGVLMPYEQKVTIVNTPQKNTIGTASKAVSASSADPIISQCNVSTSTNSYVDSQGSRIFEYRFSIYSCYTSLYNKVYGSSTFYTAPTVLYVKSGWKYSSLGGSMMSCDTSFSFYYSCTAGYQLQTTVWWINFYKGTYMTIYRSLYNSPLTPRVTISRW